MPFPPFVIRAVLMIFMLWVIGMNYKRGFVLSDKLILLFVALQWLYCLIINFSPEVSYTSVVNTSVAMLSFVFMSIMTRRAVIGNRFVTIALVLFTIVSIFAYYNAELLLMTQFKRKAGTVTVNASVLYVMLLPLLFLVKSKKVSFCCFCVAVYFILISIKRGNILASCIPAALYLYTVMRGSSLKLWQKVMIIAMLGVLSVYITDIYDNNDYYQSRIEKTKKGNSSNRDIIYPEMWQLWAEKSTPLQFIAGYGYQGTYLNSSMHKLAHNDWLELLVDNGFIGALLYFAIFVSICLMLRRLPRGNVMYALISMIIIWLIKSVVSMGYTDEALSLMALPYGVAVACVSERCKRGKQRRPKSGFSADSFHSAIQRVNQ